MPALSSEARRRTQRAPDGRKPVLGVAPAIRWRAFAVQWPNAGVPGRLVQLTLHQWRLHPTRPLPMIRR